MKISPVVRSIVAGANASFVLILRIAGIYDFTGRLPCGLSICRERADVEFEREARYQKFIEGCVEGYGFFLPCCIGLDIFVISFVISGFALLAEEVVDIGI